MSVVYSSDSDDSGGEDELWHEEEDELIVDGSEGIEEEEYDVADFALYEDARCSSFFASSTLEGHIRIYKRLWLPCMIAIADRPEYQRTLAPYVVTRFRFIFYVEYLYQLNKGNGEPQYCNKGTLASYTKKWLKRQYFMGGNDRLLRFSVFMPPEWGMEIDQSLKKHIRSERIQTHLKSRTRRAQIFPCDVSVAVKNNNPFRPQFNEDFTTITISCNIGCRGSSVCFLKLNSIKTISINARTGELTLEIEFSHMKNFGKHESYIRSISGFLWRERIGGEPDDWTFDFVYHLNLYLIERFKHGIVSPVAIVEDNNYDCVHDPTPFIVSFDDLIQGKCVDFLSFLRYREKRSKYDFGETFLFTRRSTAGLTGMMRRVFAFYPTDFLSRISFHSLRGGCYCAHVFNSFKRNGIKTAYFLMSWNQSFRNPSQHYDVDNLLSRSINYSKSLRGLPCSINLLKSPRSAHMFSLDPSIYHHDISLRESWKVTERCVLQLLKPIVSIGLNAAFASLVHSRIISGRRELVTLPFAIDVYLSIFRYRTLGHSIDIASFLDDTRRSAAIGLEMLCVDSRYSPLGRSRSSFCKLLEEVVGKPASQFPQLLIKR